jgi:hypothetical protein
MFASTTIPLVLGTPKGETDYTLAISDTSVPEPESIGLLATGVIALVGAALRKRPAS